MCRLLPLFSLVLIWGTSLWGGTSMAPVAGYAPTYGAFGGMGYFLSEPPSDLQVFGVLSTSGSMQGQIGYKRISFFDAQTKLDFKRGFENFYGFDASNSTSAQRMELTEFRVLVEALAPIAPKTKVGWRISWAQRIGEFRPPYFDYLHHLWAFEAVMEWDKQFRAMVGTNLLTGGRTNLTAHLDFHPEIELAPKTTLAFRFKAGTTVGDWDPLTEFSLGGSDQLRGYLTQRFRGKHLYLFASSLRFPLFGNFSGAVFGGVGDAFLNRGTGPKMAGGGGIHFALPPDEVQVVRLDAAVGRDQWGIYLDFGLPY